MPEARSAPADVDEFVRGLRALPEFTAQAVFDCIKAHPVRAESLRPHLFFSPANYTRNLILKDVRFELLAICWEVGQASRVHNHRDQQCWMAVPVGKLRNQNYRVVGRGPADKTCCLEESTVFMTTRGHRRKSTRKNRCTRFRTSPTRARDGGIPESGELEDS